MAIANINDRQSVEQIYPHDVWEADAGMNSQGRDGLLRGLLIESSPANDGSFNIRRAVRHIGDVTLDPYTLFMRPNLGKACDIFAPGLGVHGAVIEKHDALEDDLRDYVDFVDGLFATARRSRLHTASRVVDRLPKG